jgi:hypothetical protein
MAAPLTDPGIRATSSSDAPPASFGRYLLILFGVVIAALTLVAMFNLAVDPFLYRWPRPAWMPEPAFATFDRETHHNLVVQARSNAILIGNSQTQHGLVPSHWNAAGPVINAAAVGASMTEIRQALATAEARGHVSRAIAGLDYAMSHVAHNPPPKANEMYLLGPDGRPQLDMLKGLVTFPMLRTSASLVLETLRRRRTYGDQGEALDRLYQTSLAAHGGALGALKGRLAQFQDSLTGPTGDFPTELRALRDTACRGGVRLQVYISPNHAAWMQAIRQAGLESDWLHWKRDLVTASEERPDCRFEVWDFNTYNPITTERLPTPGGMLRYSWDGVHFRTATGDMILARMHDLKSGRQVSPPSDFGVLLTPANLESQLEKDRRDGAAYAAAHPDLLASLEPFRRRSNPPAQMRGAVTQTVGASFDRKTGSTSVENVSANGQ